MPPEIGLRHTVPGEQAVLLLLGGADTDDEIAAALGGAIDWHALLVLAASERAGAELHRRVRGLAGVDVPPEVRETLQRMAMVSDFETVHLRHCLAGALAALDSLGARVMLLKGAALIHSVYGEYGRRPMGDIDLLVDASRASEVQRALLASGEWQETVPADRSAAYRDHHHLPPLRDARGSQVHLEIHTALFADGHPFGLTPERLWAHADRLPVPDVGATSAATRGVYVPAVSHQLLHVCLHFAWSHVMQFGAWRAFRDVSAIVASGRIDWDAFVTLARETRAGTCCYWTFRLADGVAGVPVPSAVTRALRPRRPDAYLRALEHHYVRNLVPAGRASPSVRVDRALWNLGMLPTPSAFGDVRPWDRDTHFILRSAETGGRGARGARVMKLWRTIRYLSTLATAAAAPAPQASDPARVAATVGARSSAPHRYTDSRL